MNKTLIVIQGPTAVGKTSVAIQLAQQLNTDIINADSRQVFKEMKIGTARPDDAEIENVKHHLLAHRSIEENYNAEIFASEARAILEIIFKKKAAAVVCGGSGFYLKALLENMDDIPDVPEEIRAEVNSELDNKGLSTFLEELERNDPEYFKTVDKTNPQRVIRAIEVIRHTQKPFSSFHKNQKSPLPYNVLNIALTRDRENLYNRINLRVDQMLEKGLEQEVLDLKEKRNLNALQTLAYKEFYDYLDGKISRDECVELIKRNTRRYAKRQLTWLRRYDDLIWLNLDEEKSPVERILKKLNGLAQTF